jgi:hypothetical protein
LWFSLRYWSREYIRCKVEIFCSPNGPSISIFITQRRSLWRHVERNSSKESGEDEREGRDGEEEREAAGGRGDEDR